MDGTFVAAAVAIFSVFTIWLRSRNNRSFPMDDKRGSSVLEPATEGFDRTKIWDSESDDLERVDYFTDIQIYYGADQKENYIFLKLVRHKNGTAEATLFLGLSDGRVFELLNQPNTVNFDANDHKWSAAGLNINTYESERRCRITYNGLLKKGQISGNTTKETRSDIEHVRLNFIFIANSPSRYLNESCRSKQANGWKNWRRIFHSTKTLGFDEIDQWGSLIGQVRFEDSTSVDLYLQSLRKRQWTKLAESNFQKHISLTGFSNLGTSFYISSHEMRDNLNDILLGHMRNPNDSVQEITGLDFDDKNVCSNNTADEFCIKFEVEGKSIDVTFEIKKNTEKILCGTSTWNSEYRYYNLEFRLNQYKGYGLLQYWQPNDGENSLKRIPPSPKLSISQQNLLDSKIYTVSFNDPKCQIENLTGGKGSSLSILSTIEECDHAFLVPRGFCVTVFAQNSQIKLCNSLSRAIQNLTEVCCGIKKGDLKNTCQYTLELVRDTEIVESIRGAIEDEIQNLIKSVDDVKVKLKFAVRSSAVGEDGEETSAAGQNSTFLGVDEDDIVKYIAHCWASLYSYQSVEYRRQHGLPVDAPMGVCVQIMVDAEAAGVLFTRNPVSGDPRNIIITSNYGLGEAVVSGLVDPDNIIVERDPNDVLTIKQSTLGTKKQKVSLSIDRSTEVTDLPEVESSKMSIDGEIALRLAKVGIMLENFFGGSRDIEWAVASGKIFLLQSRPITALDNWTDFELIHELGSGVPNDMDILTFANVGEVLPNAVSPLSMTVIMPMLNASSESHVTKVSDVNRNTYGRNLFVVSMRCTLNYYNIFLQFPSKKLSLGHKVSDIAVSGHVIATPDIYKTAQERNGIIGTKKLLELSLQMISEMWQIDKEVKMTKQLIETRSLKDLNELKTCRDMYDEISSRHQSLLPIIITHNRASKVSVYYQLLTMSILIEGNEDLTTAHYSDIAVLLSTTSNVISGKVPVAMRKIAEAVKEDGLEEEFSKVNKTEAKEWLRVHSPKAFETLAMFLEEHGCRGVMEFDFMAETWDMKPDELLATIQVIASSDKEETVIEDLTPRETIERLKTPTRSSTRWLLKKLVPYCRRAVERREMTKFLVIRYVHELRMAYRKLAALLTKEARLPDENLIFFLTHAEIGTLIDKPCPALLRKIVRRRKVHGQMQKCRFEEMYVGMPLFNEMSSEVTRRKDGVVVRGTAVCNGVVTGRACVVFNLSEAAKLRSGDILITRGTDIGWSPYFPLLGGVVTELGGIISHGAVVAREYGLPCVVSAVGAMKIFQTGDRVRLNGTTGTIEAIEEESRSSEC